MTNPAAGTSSAAQRSTVAAADYLPAAPTPPQGTRPAGHLRSCPFRGPKGMAGGVSSGGLCGGSPVCAARGAQPAGGGAGVRAEPGHDRQDVSVFGSAGLSAQQTAGEAETGSADAGD